ncbi:MAG: DUF2235 domain-containing protein, partial [Chlorobiales bacterium]|nr:DUF2235 domain-containing protein [Chlorobiales bacterium]
MEPVKKNIVLCSDGTGNQDIKARGTNVFKLYEAVDIQGHKESPNLKQQVAFYDDGVGTSSLLHLKLIGGMFGWGFSQNVRDLYTELIHVYQPGDKIYLFGFSRGAYTVRALSGLIECCGIVDTSKALTESEIENRVSACWKVFKKEAFKRWQLDRKRQQSIPVTNEDAATALRKQLGAIVDETHAPDGKIPIEFVGVWDTVGAVGAPFEGMKDLLNWFFPRRFAELTPSSNVSRARQAISIDDERRTFHPELWNEKGARDENHVRQVWFAGVHSNVGGGYAKHGMSLVALDWMMSEAAACGLRFIDNDSEYVRSHQDVHDKLFDSRAGVAVYYRWQPRNIVELCHKHNMETPRIHVSVFERIANATEGYTPGNIPFMCEVVTT